MIEAGYVRTMARYNAWQNRQLMDFLNGVDDTVLRTDRKAFFGSIMGTLNHILFADTLWMCRFDPHRSVPNADVDHLNFTPTFAVWSAERFRMDGAIRLWADTLRTLDLRGQLTWHSGSLGKELRQPMDLCVIGFFNHQTHHRGQVHAMMTAAGLEAPVTDVVYMPEDT